MNNSNLSRKKKVLIFVISILIPLGVGGLGVLFMPDMKSLYGSLTKPWFAPPAYIFPIVWTILYIMMGTASYMVYIKKYEDVDISSAIFSYGMQLLLNLFWPIIFFGFRLYGLAFIELIILLGFVLITCWRFYKKGGKKPALLLVPYVLWLTYAGILNFFVWMLNEM